RPLVRSVRAIERRHVGIERIGVLHDELAGAENAGARPGLVALLRLDLIPDLRQVTVRADLPRSDPRNHLLVSHRQTQVPGLAILQAEHLGADGVPPAAVAPDL